MKRAIWGLGLFFFAIAPCLASDAADKVRDGIRLLKEGDLKGAGLAFADADVTLPENERIAFDQACVSLAAGEWDKALPLLQEAALSREEAVAEAARYNLGILATARAREVFGQTPEDADPSKRQEGMDHLLQAVRHFRSCIELNPESEDARHNLELIRLWIKQMEATWKEKDKQKARDEMNLLQFLAMIEEKQTQYRERTRLLKEEADSPRRRQAFRELESEQRALEQEIGPLKDKIEAAFKESASKGQQPAPDADQIAQALKVLNGWADDAGAQMARAADALPTAPQEAPALQKKVLDSLNRIFGAVASFEAVVTRALTTQQSLVDETKPLAEENSEGEGADFEELEWPQERVAEWSQVLGYKATEGLKNMNAQTGAALPPQAQQGAAEDGLKEAMEKAVELCPAILEKAQAAAGHLKEEAPKAALPLQEEALEKLREIAKTLPKNNEDQQGDQNQDPRKKEDQQDQNKNQGKQPKEDQGREQQKLTRDEAKALLQKAKEREREHQDRQERLERALAAPGKVDKDW